VDTFDTPTISNTTPLHHTPIVATGPKLYGKYRTIGELQLHVVLISNSLVGVVV